MSNTAESIKARELVDIFRKYEQQKFREDNQLLEFRRTQTLCIDIVDFILHNGGRELATDEEYWNNVKEEIKKIEP